MSDVGMHDAIAYANPGQTRAKTMKKGGSEAVDHILATGGVLGFILAAGEIHYDYTYVSDHPSLFCDVDGAILSGDFTHFSKEQGRKLHYKDKVAVAKYNNLLEKLCEENSINERTDKLCTVSAKDWTPHHTLKLNNLDRHITRLMKRAAKKCRKKRAKGHMYSKERGTANGSQPLLLLEPPPKVHATPSEHQEGNPTPQTAVRQDPRPHASHQARSPE
jgi:hypothetical protein